MKRGRQAQTRADLQTLLSAARSVISLGFLVFSGCKVGPDYHRPAPLASQPMPADFSVVSGTNTIAWKLAQPAAHVPRGPWWQVFGDPELEKLETLAGSENQELAATIARFDEARASVNVARAELFPQFAVSPNYVRQRTSENQPQDGQAAGFSTTYNTFTASLQAGWEIDIWGRVRREVENARARLNASAEDLESVKLAIQAEVAVEYFGLRALDTEYDLIERTAGSYRRTLGYIINRRRGGIASDLDVAQAETQLRTAEADLPAVRLQRSTLAHALGTLCGQPATIFAVDAWTNALALAPTIPTRLPSELLERRPDIAAAEQRVAAANAQVGVAHGAFYPRIQFNGLAGFESIDAASWFSWPSRFWSFGPAIELPLFTGGRNRAQLAFAEASYHETVANYRQTVLSAFQEVEDQLAAQDLLKTQLEATRAALVAAQRTLELANNRYRSGLVTYLEVSAAQRAELLLERTVVELRGRELTSAISLIKALGGGWEDAAHTNAASH